jgi:hypothetical protein
MSVADQDLVHIYGIMSGRSGRIPAEERVNNQFVSTGFEAKSGMSVPDEFITHFFLLTNITAQGCITDTHSLPEITEKMGVRGGAHPFFRDFLGTLRCNANPFLQYRPKTG